MPMNRNDLLNAICDDAITEIPLAYPRPDQNNKREGAIAAFEDCRGKSDEEIQALLVQAQVHIHARTQSKPLHDRQTDIINYWYWRMYELQVEWVLNVLSAARAANGLVPLTAYTARGVLKAADILGV